MNKKEIEEVFRRLNLLGDFHDQAPVLLWPEAAGERLSCSSEALYVKDGTLHVRVSSSAAGCELRLRSAGIIRRLNELSGRPVIRRIKIDVGGRRSDPRD